jgi:hypothetical protein
MKRVPKSCESCHRQADCSISVLISTLGRVPREQKLSKSVPFCASCIQEFYEHAHADTAAKLRNTLKDAYTKLEDALSECPHNNLQTEL